MNERCPNDGKFMAVVGPDNWSCTSCGKGWRIYYSKTGSRICSEVAPMRPTDDKISTRELLERIAEKLGVNIEV